MAVSDPVLWSTISGWPMPRYAPAKWWENKPPDFETWVERDESVSPEDARRMIKEYRRFIYLKALDGGTLTPPEDVDKVWHLHMKSPDGDWTSFCQRVAGRPIEHNTGLSRADAAASYARAMSLYRREFGMPPCDIWPDAAQHRRHSIAIAGKDIGATICCLGVGLGIIAQVLIQKTVLIQNSLVTDLAFYGPMVAILGGTALLFVGGLIDPGTGVTRTAVG